VLPNFRQPPGSLEELFNLQFCQRASCALIGGRCGGWAQGQPQTSRSLRRPRKSCNSDGVRLRRATRGFRFCAQEIEGSPQRRVALGVSQHGTDSLTLRVAEDFQSGRFVLGHCAFNRLRDMSQALLAKPPREFVDLVRGA
jgi:hypothetical protein